VLQQYTTNSHLTTFDFNVLLIDGIDQVQSNAKSEKTTIETTVL